MDLELGRELESVGPKVAASKAAFLEAIEWYDSTGQDLEQKVFEHVEPFYGPQHHRALLIQNSARNLETQIRHFSSTRADLSNRVVTLLLAMDTAVSSLGVDVLNLRIPVVSGTEEDLRRSLDSFVEVLDDVEQRSLFLAARAVIVGHATDQALQTLTNPISIRSATLEQYVAMIGATEYLLAAMKPKFFQPLIAASGLEAMLIIAERVMEISALALGIIVPIAGLAVAILGVAVDVREHQRLTHERYEHDVNARYERVEVDEMLDLAPQLEAETASTDDALARVAELTDGLIATHLP